MTTVLISGAGVAGPSLAFWLSRYGCSVTVVEQADRLRDSGAAVDFRGDQMALLERMGIIDELRACATGMPARQAQRARVRSGKSFWGMGSTRLPCLK